MSNIEKLAGNFFLSLHPGRVPHDRPKGDKSILHELWALFLVANAMQHVGSHPVYEVWSMATAAITATITVIIIWAGFGASSLAAVKAQKSFFCFFLCLSQISPSLLLSASSSWSCFPRVAMARCWRPCVCIHECPSPDSCSIWK